MTVGSLLCNDWHSFPSVHDSMCQGDHVQQGVKKAVEDLTVSLAGELQKNTDLLTMLLNTKIPIIVNIDGNKVGEISLMYAQTLVKNGVDVKLN